MSEAPLSSQESRDAASSTPAPADQPAPAPPVQAVPGRHVLCYDLSGTTGPQGEIHEETSPTSNCMSLSLPKGVTFCTSAIKKRHVYLVSDIRSSRKDLGHQAFEERVQPLHAVQLGRNHRPVVAHLKWRMPYTHQEAPIMTPSRFMLEPWVDADSGELRQTIERPPDGAPYAYDTMTLEQFENKKMIHNNVISPYAYYEHPVPCSGYYYYDEKKSIEDAGHGLDHCWSCAYELACWCVYLGFDTTTSGSPFSMRT